MKLNGGCLAVIGFISYWLLFAFVIPFPKFVDIEHRIGVGFIVLVGLTILAAIYNLGETIFKD